ncbi:hypothetical protein MASR2M15_22200 [Anaerolineales bacterium]
MYPSSERQNDQEPLISYQEKLTLLSIFTTLASFIPYAIFIFNKYQAMDASGPDIANFWAIAILLLLPVLVIAQIVTQILFIVLHMVITKKEEPTLSDELDQLIDLKSTRNFYHLFMLGFFLSMLAVALGGQLSMMFMILFIALIIAGIFADVSKIYFYRRGF